MHDDGYSGVPDCRDLNVEQKVCYELMVARLELPQVKTAEYGS